MGQPHGLGMDALFRRLQLYGPLEPDERRGLEAAFAGVRTVEANHDLIAEGARPAFVGVLLDGLLCRYKVLPGGERQIVALPTPGDMFDLQGLVLRRMDHSIGAVARSTVAFATLQAAHELMDAHPRLAALFWRDAVVECSILREWVVNCGRRTAYARMAHLFCELSARLAAVGLGKGGAYPLPLTQADLADALGLSVVHVNRTLQQLRAERLVAFKGRRLSILDRAGLIAAGGFRADYLHVAEPMEGDPPKAGKEGDS